MKKLITILLILLTTNANGQALKKLYDKVFKYSTVYVAGDIKEAYETQYPDYFIRTNPDDLYAEPDRDWETVEYLNTLS